MPCARWHAPAADAMIASMLRLRFLTRFAASLAMLAAVCAAHGWAQAVSPAELRRMTPSQFQRHLDEEGPAAFVARVVKDIDPHSPEEPNYDIILEHIAEGSTGWVRIAGKIGPYADPRFSEGLNVAIADALIENPVAVLRLIGTEPHFGQACGYPFIHQTDHYLRLHQKQALAAMRRVQGSGLAEKKSACIKQLMQLPIQTASESTQGAEQESTP